MDRSRSTSSLRAGVDSRTDQYESPVVRPHRAAYVARTMLGVEFRGYGGDCTIVGQVTMFGDRLTDFLNGQERFRLHHVRLTSLEDGHEVDVDSISVERQDLLLVVGTGPRGSLDRRIELEEARLQLAIGPYVILGRLHLAPGLDPLQHVLQREPMVPLTQATIAFSLAGQTTAQDVDTVIVNRHLVEWISASAEEASVFPDAVIRSPFALNLSKDFTGAATY